MTMGRETLLRHFHSLTTDLFLLYTQITMNFRKYQLKNGLRIILSPIKESKSTTALVLVGTGSRYERKENNGISHFLEHMFFKGTKNRPKPQDVVSDLDAIGGEYNAFTSQECTGFWAKVSNHHLDVALNWLADILFHSKFSPREIEKEKGVVIEEINLYEDLPSRKIFHNWLHLLYGRQPLGWPVLGTKENVKKINQKMLLSYLQSQYQATNTVLCLSGNLPSLSSVVKKISKVFRFDSTNEFCSPLKIKDTQKKPGVSVEYKKTDQSHLIVGFRGLDINHPDQYALQLISTILGGYMSSRLFVEVREKRGLAYHISSVVEFFTDTGFIAARAGVSNNRIEEAIKVILQEFKKIQKGNISITELNKAKENLIGRLFLSLESSDEIATWLAEQEVFRNKILTPQQIANRIKKVELTDLKRVAREIFRPQRLNLAIIGPFKNREVFENILQDYA